MAYDLKVKWEKPEAGEDLNDDVAYWVAGRCESESLRSAYVYIEPKVDNYQFTFFPTEALPRQSVTVNGEPVGKTVTITVPLSEWPEVKSDGETVTVCRVKLPLDSEWVAGVVDQKEG